MRREISGSYSPTRPDYRPSIKKGGRNVFFVIYELEEIVVHRTSAYYSYDMDLNYFYITFQRISLESNLLKSFEILGGGQLR
jgi:hypothetical protein